MWWDTGQVSMIALLEGNDNGFLVLNSRQPVLILVSTVEMSIRKLQITPYVLFKCVIPPSSAPQSGVGGALHFQFLRHFSRKLLKACWRFWMIPRSILAFELHAETWTELFSMNWALEMSIKWDPEIAQFKHIQAGMINCESTWHGVT